MMPSARRYDRNGAERGMRRALGVRERYQLGSACALKACS